MPALPDVPQVFKLTFTFAVGADANAIVRLHGKYAGPAPDDSACDTYCIGVDGLISADMAAVLDTESAYTGCELVDLTSPTSGVGTHHGPVAAGARAGTPMGANAAVLVNMPISRRYRGGKPRSYWPWGVAEDLSDRQVWTSGAVTTWDTTVADIFVAMTVTPLGTATVTSVCSVSYYQGFTPVFNPITGRTRDVSSLRAGGPVVDLITGASASAKLSSQRRRNLQRT